ncbi:hypothetical protein A2662_00640 [Candidatus Giovannonibacteria bacterium RIFCSPHIGHO2_01_FULL_45_33]|uniref:Uncharacterized protein n=1 Tax=Candidatus Giovannonibacteria bacterium RIFCSPLOWO2_01_FULL_45_34 TaxID=1798351 RepID=A0A1F5WZ00_9BACT|nr:MAG: hypothetical protein A2662_00640 [Candidatus Giovannonibacteria bacterium RIFCSPHIGHO2_01_FULL_45_33]OGF68872.1 MAG: hypothetical protein A3C73_02495 [Candidatus Giovannonibacteria bacterium RIFCSPHIGHO2_02_FULL_44_11]OGF80833.1 MAG: hypothetical protein A2930_00455 [Candidatus Giovannonibacteria bacterium RIFCSPLOWO2_01_FULL_45_34]
MEFDKRKKSFGEIVSKKEVLKELGHPRTWGPNERKLEFQRHLKYGRKRLDIQGLKGYVAYLKQSFEKPTGSDTGLIGKNENKKILASAKSVITKTLKKCKKRLVRLEKDPLEVAFYISDVARNIDMYQSMGWMNPEKENLEEMRALALESNIKNSKKISDLKEELKKYKTLFTELREKTYQNRK